MGGDLPHFFIFDLPLRETHPVFESFHGLIAKLSLSTGVVEEDDVVISQDYEAIQCVSEAGVATVYALWCSTKYRQTRLLPCTTHFDF